MSDPVTNVEIEDVLSSIRRLVSNTGEAAKEQGQPSEKAQDFRAERAAKPVDAGMDRLVLTPSLRVDSEAESVAGSDAAESAEPAEDEDDFAVNLTDASPVHAVSDLPDAGEEAPFIEAEDEDAPHLADVTDLGRDAALSELLDTELSATELPDADADAGPAPQEAQAMAEAAEIAAEDRATIDADAAWGAPEGALQARIAELEAAVATREEDWEPDGTTSEAYSGGQVEALPWEDFNGSDDLSELEVPADEAAEGEAMAEPMANPAPLGKDRLQETEEPEAAEPENVTPEAAEPDAVAEAREGRAKEDALGAEGDAILDEEALRDLVAEIVRDELQGALGERITRNVRKLVRREIHRAMAIQDLE
ncbi:hypothetical protein [Roseovarius sp.]|uniref:hypothetical protein n=1 Tax=Roseovarius sp. TaxID=1486281 RepID=UPI003519A575